MKLIYSRMSYGNLVHGKYVVPIEAGEEIIQSAMQDFMNSATERGLEYRGPIIYYLEQINQDKYRIHFLLPIDNQAQFVGDEKIEVYSYFGHEETICYRAKRDELKKVLSILEQMDKQCSMDGKRTYGPLYYVLPKDPSDEIFYLHRPIE